MIGGDASHTGDTAAEEASGPSISSLPNLKRHVRYMEMALNEATIALNDNEVPVGCVFVDRNTGEVIARGFNRTNQERNVLFFIYISLHNIYAIR